MASSLPSLVRRILNATSGRSCSTPPYGFFPAGLDLAAEHRTPGGGIVRRPALGQSERSIRVQRLARDRLARRFALVEQLGDLGLIVMALDDLRLRRLRRLGGLLLRLRRLLLLSFFSASAIGSTFGGSCFFSIGFGSSFGFSATGFGGSGFFSTGFSSTFGLRRRRGLGDDGRLLVVDLATVSSAGLASATFSTSGRGFSFLPVFMPAMTLAS